MGQLAGFDVGGDLPPVELQEVHGAEEVVRERGSDAAHGVAVAQAAQHLHRT
jgi:hypothetical protein